MSVKIYLEVIVQHLRAVMLNMNTQSRFTFVHAPDPCFDISRYSPERCLYTVFTANCFFSFSAARRARLHTRAVFAPIVKIFSHINFTPFKVSFRSRCGNFITPGLCTAKINKNLFCAIKASVGYSVGNS